MTKKINLDHEYKQTKQACLMETGAIGALVGIEYLQLKLLFDELEPEIPTFEATKDAYLTANYVGCIETMEDTGAQDFTCEASEAEIQANYDSVVLQAENDLANFHDNVAPYEPLGTTGVSIAFAAVALLGIVKPTVQRLLHLRRDIQNRDAEAAALEI